MFFTVNSTICSGVIVKNSGSGDSGSSLEGSSQESVDVSLSANSDVVVVRNGSLFVPVEGVVDEFVVVKPGINDFVLDSVVAPWHEWILLHDFVVVFITATESEETVLSRCLVHWVEFVAVFDNID